MINTGITPEACAKSIGLLQSLHASHFVLMTAAWGAHWNVVGHGFHSNHNFLKELYEAEQDRVDTIAERIRALDGFCAYSLDQMLNRTLIGEFPEGTTFTKENVWKELLVKWEGIIREMRTNHSIVSEQDLATRSMLEGMLEAMEKEAWMIRSFTE